MEHPKISVIMPIYKAEKYLDKCVTSILQQTFRDFELLLIDDGSPDGCGRMCDEYAQRDSRVKVFHKPNGGVSSARQFGIDNASGEYTIHVDPDDWVEKDMLQELYQTATKDNYDIVICDYWEETLNGQKYISQQPTSLENESLISEMLCQHIHGNCWNKLVKKDCYKTVKFPIEQNYSEDLFVNLHFAKNGAKYGYLNKAFYHYNLFTNDNSIMRGSKLPLYLQGLKFIELIKDICPKEQYPEGYATQYADLAIRAFCCNAYSTKELKATFEMWENEYKFKSKISSFWKAIIYLSTELYLYKLMYSLIILKRKIKL